MNWCLENYTKFYLHETNIYFIRKANKLSLRQRWCYLLADSTKYYSIMLYSKLYFYPHFNYVSIIYASMNWISQDSFFSFHILFLRPSLCSKPDYMWPNFRMSVPSRNSLHWHIQVNLKRQTFPDLCNSYFWNIIHKLNCICLKEAVQVKFKLPTHRNMIGYITTTRRPAIFFCHFRPTGLLFTQRIHFGAFQKRYYFIFFISLIV
jgi:hypothetical protein